MKRSLPRATAQYVPLFALLVVAVVPLVCVLVGSVVTVVPLVAFVAVVPVGGGDVFIAAVSFVGAA